MLGGTFMGHHGGWHREATLGVIVPENRKHPILIGVGDIWGTSDVYRCHDDKNPFPDDCTSLVLGQPLINLEKDAPTNTNKEPLPVAWTKTWTGNKGKTSKIFHFTMGSARDLGNEGVNRWKHVQAEARAKAVDYRKKIRKKAFEIGNAACGGEVLAANVVDPYLLERLFDSRGLWGDFGHPIADFGDGF